MSIFGEVNEIDKSVKNGELNQVGMLSMPKTGEAILFAVGTENKDGRNYIEFYMTLPGSNDYRRWDIRCPAAGDTDAAKWMGIQNIYNTLFGCLKRDPKSMLIDKCYTELEEKLKGNSIRISYECEETEYIAQKGKNMGKEVKSSFLRTITGLAMIQKINIEIKPKQATPPPAAQSNWGQPSTGFGPSSEVPF